MEKYKVVVIGGGLVGFVVVLESFKNLDDKKVLIIERDKFLGGILN